MNSKLETFFAEISKKRVAVLGVGVTNAPLAELLIRHPDNPFGLKFFAEHMCFSIEKARRDLNYIPRHGVEETIAETAYLTALRFK